ncbi:hypothetical protein C8R27_12216 [Nitrosomonas ureae]|uniref:hypothetical protein n=1 Tax=Nitrosomonas ureae TaxID=44577 RepID=UPI000D75ADB1|nr:hypothetical protein [Nitrosomonas ureae]PXX12822.1 hypothetical protein C8R27_12216 [Nitrosomonas ureae]
MPEKNKISGKDLQNYLKSYQLIRECIVDSISKLRKRNRDLSITPKEEADNCEEILKLVADKVFLDAKLAAFEAHRHSISPPSEQQLNSLINLVAEVEKLNTNQAIFKEIVQLSTNALTEFNNIHPNQA